MHSEEEYFAFTVLDYYSILNIIKKRLDTFVNIFATKVRVFISWICIKVVFFRENVFKRLEKSTASL